jgi:hypothetical protein
MAEGLAGSIEEGATESLRAARQADEDPTTGQRIKGGACLEIRNPGGDARGPGRAPPIRLALFTGLG